MRVEMFTVSCNRGPLIALRCYCAFCNCVGTSCLKETALGHNVLLIRPYELHKYEMGGTNNKKLCNPFATAYIISVLCRGL